MSKLFHSKNFLIRALLTLFVLISLLLFYPQFYQQFDCYLHGKANILSQEWQIVFLNILLFLLLLLPLSFRRKAHWGEYGMITAFFVSLFIEMYGFPLTIYFASRYFTEPVQCAEAIFNFKLLGVGFGMELAMIYTSLFITVGTLLILVGWVTLYRNVKKNQFVTTGIYKYSRHPQYLGFILIVFGWFIDWPTLITVIFAPLLIYKYIRVCVTEEKEILAQSPEYQKYIDEVPFFI